ncbi:MAG TPA: lipoate--protein ligase family protein [Ktedonobacter sp.]|nr:lipoate--protein ligase family protein [Ktedonobacter sp.]
MQSHYRLIVTDPMDAALNMAIDEAILTHYLRGDVPATLRAFRWQRPSISLGRFQSVEREIELERCQEHGIVLVRRPTGGRAVYHRDDFTYSIVIGKRDNVPTGVVAAYAYLAQGLLAALGHLGIEAIMSEEHVSKNPSAACFASSTQADLTASGFKVVGSAQVWKDDALLQQGSLPLDDHTDEFFSFLRYPSHEARAQAITSYREATTPLHTFAPTVSATWNEVLVAFHKGFAEALDTPFVPGALLDSELALAHQLVAEKYSTLVWRKERITLV